MGLKSKNAIVSLQQGNRSGVGEFIDWTYWDTAKLAVATRDHRFFAQAQGQGTPIKRLDQTNMTQGGQMPQGQNLKVHAIKITYLTSAVKGTTFVNAFYNMINTAILDIRFPGKDSMGQWSLSELLATASMVALTPTGATGDNIPLVQPVVKACFPLNRPIDIPALQPFEAVLTHYVACPTLCEDDILKVGFYGGLKRLS